MYQLSMAIVCMLFAPFVSLAQTITTIAGYGTFGYSGDGGSATAARIGEPCDMTIDSSGNLYFPDGGSRIRKIDVAGVISTIAGRATAGFSGDGGVATAAELRPLAIGSDRWGNVYVADEVNNRIRKIDTTGIIATSAGSGTTGTAMGGYAGDGGPATGALLSLPRDVVADSRGNVYIVDHYNYRIRKVDAAGIIITIAGTGTPGYDGDGGPATAARIYPIYGIAADGWGNVYISTSPSRVRKIDTTGIITTVVGTGIAGYSGDGGAATAAQYGNTQFLAADYLGNLYLPDEINHNIRKVSTSGTITTIAGTGTAGYSGDGGPATAAQLNWPRGTALDAAGNLYIGDSRNYRIRKISIGNHIPAFTAGSTQTLALCAGAGTTSLDALLATTDADTGQSITWRVRVAPAHGTLSAAYTAVSTGGTLLPSGLSYTPASGYTGNDTFMVMIDDGTSVGFTTFHATITPLPNAGTISGTDTLCMGDTVALAATIPGGSWSSSNAGVATISATGQAVGLGIGPATIRYLVTNSCGTDTATHSLLVLPAGLCHTGIATLTVAGLPTLYPNPASGVCNLYLPGAGVATITLTDITGRIVQVVETNTANTTIPLTALASGTYLIIARWAGGVWNGRVVVE